MEKDLLIGRDNSINQERLVKNRIGSRDDAVKRFERGNIYRYAYQYYKNSEMR